MRWLRIAVLLPAAFALGCEELDQFRTGPNEVFYGEVIGADRDGGASFIRQGFPAHTQMALTFDPARASANAANGELRSAGALTTYQCPNGDERCGVAARTPGYFDAAPLDPIANLGNDALSQYDFPGGGRLRNYIFGARFTTPDHPAQRVRDAMVFVSLMENGKIEVRVIAQSLLDAEGAQLDPALFGVFTLERRPK